MHWLGLYIQGHKPIKPPFDLYLNFEKSSWKRQVRRTGFLKAILPLGNLAKLVFWSILSLKN
jgi:hypothetical protein